MNPTILNIIERYNTLKINLKERFESFFLKEENTHLFENWTRLHLDLFYNFSLEKQVQLEEINTQFMAKRARMASAFMQGLKIANSQNKEIKIFKSILKDHDEVFKNLLAEVLRYYSEELIKVQRFRKVTAAYVQSHYNG